MKRSLLAGWVWYRGGPFRGFQAQVKGPTVQGELSRALAGLGLAVTPAPAGRTDLGVHARMQVVSFRLPEALGAQELSERLAPLLPMGLGLGPCVRAPPGFHPQWRCTGKEYRYRFRLGGEVPGWEGLAWNVRGEERLGGRTPSLERLEQLLIACEGRRDFIAFHEKSSVRKLRTLEQARLVELGAGLFEARLRGDGFGRYQVRYLLGSAVATAAGMIAPEAFQAALCSATPMEGLKAPSEGLVLWEVLYPAQADPFSAEQRALAPGVPPDPPFCSS